jgi:hypothetical protein
LPQTTIDSRASSLVILLHRPFRETPGQSHNPDGVIDNNTMYVPQGLDTGSSGAPTVPPFSPAQTATHHSRDLPEGVDFSGGGVQRHVRPGLQAPQHVAPLLRNSQLFVYFIFTTAAAAAAIAPAAAVAAAPIAIGAAVELQPRYGSRHQPCSPHLVHDESRADVVHAAIAFVVPPTGVVLFMCVPVVVDIALVFGGGAFAFNVCTWGRSPERTFQGV